jgi:hypothetical protein
MFLPQTAASPTYTGLVTPSPSWKPREAFSPSQLATARDCRRKWGYGYLLGLRRAKPLKAAALGSLVHACLEAYLAGGTVYDFKIDRGLARDLEHFDSKTVEAMQKHAPRCALSGLQHLPRLDDPAIERLDIEKAINIDTAAIVSHIHGFSLARDPIIIRGRRDLGMTRAGVRYLYDHKSTGGRKSKNEHGPADSWAYVKTPEQLLTDEQAVLYGMAEMQEHGLSELWSRWVYYLTDEKKAPASRPLDIHQTLPQVEAEAKKLIHLAFDLRQLIRARADVEKLPLPVLPPDPASPCNKYGGCPYRADRGGPCNGPLQNLGALIASAPQSKQEKEKEEMTQQAPTPPPKPDDSLLGPGMAWVLTPQNTWTVGNAPQPPMAPPEQSNAPATIVAPPPVGAAAPVDAHADTERAEVAADEKPAKKRRGRPKGSTKKEEAIVMPTSELDAKIEAAVGLMRKHELQAIEFHENGNVSAVIRFDNTAN